MSTVKVAFRMLCAAILLLAVIEIAWMNPARSAEATEGAATPAQTVAPTPAAPAPEGGAPPAAMDSEGVMAPKAPPVEEPIAKELEAKRSKLDLREHELEEREGRLKDREKEIDQKIKALDDLRVAVGGEFEEQRKNNEDKVKKLVTVFETMTPKSSAAVFETLDDWLAVECLKRMDTLKVAKVMNIMDKSRSARLSEMLTGYYHPENDRKISSVKNTGGQAVAAAAGNGAKPTAPAQNAPASPSAPQNQK